MRRLIFLFTLIFASCSTTHFYSDGRANLGQAIINNPEVSYSVNVRREYYLWGMFPSTAEIKVDDAILRYNHFRQSEVTITPYRTSGDLWTMFLTLGLYTPTHYKFDVRGNKYEGD